MPMNFDDPVLKQAYKNYLTSIYGGESDQVNDIYSGVVNSQNGGGVDLRGYVNSILTGDNTGLNAANQKITKASEGTINRNFNNASNKVNENIAAQGLSRSGVSAGAMVDLEGKRGDALVQNEAAGAARQLESIRMAINSILGLDQLDLSTFNSLAGNKANADQNNLAIENSKFSFADLLPGLLQGGAKVGTALATGGASLSYEDILNGMNTINDVSKMPTF